MKIKINIDCSPQEARTFMGLPDIKPMQDAMMDEMNKRFQAEMKNLDPQTIIKNWFMPSMQTMEQFQNAMWNAATSQKKDKG